MSKKSSRREKFMFENTQILAGLSCGYARIKLEPDQLNGNVIWIYEKIPRIANATWNVARTLKR